jgi:hypothetical protein
MKLVCPRCKSRLHTLYVRIPIRGLREFASLEGLGWCDKEGGVVHVPTKRLFRETPLRKR